MTNTTEFLAQVFKIEELVQYQANAIVSKQILKHNSGNLTFFAFDKDEALSKHSAPYDATVLILDGKVEITLGEKTHTLQKGEFIIMPANIPHALKAIERFKMLLILVRPN